MSKNKTYLGKKDDTIESVALANGMTKQQLAAANNLDPSDNIEGVNLVIPKVLEEAKGVVPSLPGSSQITSANGTWETQLDDTINKILNREKFSYDLNGDAFYNQYKDKYTELGKMAMEDTMGRASAMTGGYGNSYAQSVGQQAYNAKLQELNDMTPEFYQIALDRYNQEGQGLLEDFSRLLSERDTYLDGIASSSTDGIDDYTKWLMEYNLDAAKAGYSVDAYGNLVPKEEEPKEDYKGRFSALTSPEEIVAKLDSYDLLKDGMPVLKSMGVNTVGEGRALALIHLFNSGEIDSEDLDFLAQKYNLSEEEMDKALELYNKKA